MNSKRTIRLKIDVPFLVEGGVYELRDETGEVFRIDKGGEAIGPLRNALAGYLWLIVTEPQMIEVLSVETAYA